MVGKPLTLLTRVVIGITSFAVLIALYGYLSHQEYQKRPKQKYAPGFSAFVEGFHEMTQLRVEEGDEGASWWERQRSRWIVRDLSATLSRFAVGILVGSAVAFLMGISMGCSRYVEAALLPPVAFLASIPPTAMMVVYTLFLGIDFVLLSGVIALGIFPTLAQSIFQAVRNDVSEHALYKASTLGASRFEVIWEVIIPQILPRIIDAIRLQIGPALIFLIAAEIQYSDEGFGYVMKIFSRILSYNVIFIYLIILGLFGMLVDTGMKRLRGWLCPWFGD